MKATEIVAELEALGTEPYKRVLRNHGVEEPVLGVKIEELKKIRKRAGRDHDLALALYDTGIYDAQYLAGLMADEDRMTPDDLRCWLEKSNCRAIAAFSVAWVTAESPHGWELAREWIESADETTAETGWMTLSSLVALRDDSSLDLPELERLLHCAESTLHHQPNYVRYAMNSFVIALGTYVRDLTEQAIRTGESVGRVTVNMGNTACEVPFAPDYIRKVQARGTVGKKRKTVRC